jgi:nucleotide-binding universal stress UspA family protein
MTDQPILIACDGGEHDRDALALGRVLAGLTAASMEAVAVHPCTPLAASIVGERWAAMTRGNADDALDAARSEIGDARDAAFHRIAASSPALGLDLAAEEADAAVIVVGSTRRGRIGRVLPGPTAMQILVDAPCPIAIAPVGYARRAARPARIGVGFDGSEESVCAVELASRLAGNAGARLEVIGVLAGPARRSAFSRRGDAERFRPERWEARQRLERIAAAVGGDVRARLLEGAPPRSLIAATEALDLILVGSHGRGALGRALVGSVSARLLREAACPVLVVPRACLPLAVSPASALAISSQVR